MTEKEMTVVEAAQYLLNKGSIIVDHSSTEFQVYSSKYIDVDALDLPSEEIEGLKIPAMGTGHGGDFGVVVPVADISIDVYVQDDPSHKVFSDHIVYQWDNSPDLKPDVYPATREGNEAGYTNMCNKISNVCANQGIRITDGDEKDIVHSIEAAYSPMAQGCLDKYIDDIDNYQILAYGPNKANEHHGIYKGQVLTGYTDNNVYTNKNPEQQLTATVVHPRDAFDLNDDELAGKVGEKVDIAYKDGQAKMVDTKEKTISKDKGREV